MYKYLLNILLGFLLLLFLLPSCSGRQQEVQELFARAAQWEEAGRPDSALLAYRRVLLLLEEGDDADAEARAHAKAGELLFKHSLYDFSLEEYRQACVSAARLADKALLSASLRGMAKNYWMKDSMRRADECFHRALQCVTQVADSQEVGALYNNVASHHFYQGVYAEALCMSRLSLQYASDDTMLHRSYLLRGHIGKATGQYDSAAYYYYQCVDFPDIYIRGAALLSLMRLYEQLGDTLRADAYSKQYHLRLDTIEYQQRTDEMSLAYLRQAVQEAASANVSVKGWWAGMLAFLLAGAGAYFVWRRRKRRLIQALRQAKRREQALGSCWQAFQASGTYQKICQLQEEESGNLRSKQAVSVTFSREEQEALAAEVFAACPDWAEQLRRACPLLSEQEILYCCLAGRLGLSNFCIGRCMNLSPGAVRQCKLRVKRKLEASKAGRKLWKQIFHKEQNEKRIRY